MKGYPKRFSFSELGTCRRYAESGGRGTDEAYYKISLPALEAVCKADEVTLSSFSVNHPSPVAENFVVARATAELMLKQFHWLDSRKLAYQQIASLLFSIKGFSSSRDLEHDIALDVPTGGSFVRPSSIRKRKCAVCGDANRTRIEQAPEFCELRAVRAHLGHRDRDAQLRGLLGIGEAQEHREQRAATLERAQETTSGGTAEDSPAQLVAASPPSTWTA